MVRQRWLHLEVLEEIGRGAHGVVYRAWDTRLAREVALKLMVHEEAVDSIAEARRLARVSHPNVVSIHGAERVERQVGLWMELLRGRTLEQIVRDQGPFSPRETGCGCRPGALFRRCRR
jgi:serine/threonine protein kinase